MAATLTPWALLSALASGITIAVISFLLNARANVQVQDAFIVLTILIPGLNLAGAFYQRRRLVRNVIRTLRVDADPTLR